LNGKLDYKGPFFSARLDRDTLEPEKIDATAGITAGDELSLETCATMYVLLNGIRRSLPYVPTAINAELADSGRIAHPGYAE
jgi:hypothetical protein